MWIWERNHIHRVCVSLCLSYVFLPEKLFQKYAASKWHNDMELFLNLFKNSYHGISNTDRKLKFNELKSQENIGSHGMSTMSLTIMSLWLGYQKHRNSVRIRFSMLIINIIYYIIINRQWYVEKFKATI